MKNRCMVPSKQKTSDRCLVSMLVNLMKTYNSLVVLRVTDLSPIISLKESSTFGITYFLSLASRWFDAMLFLYRLASNLLALLDREKECYCFRWDPSPSVCFMDPYKVTTIDCFNLALNF